MIYKGPSLGKPGPTCTSFYSFVRPFFFLPTEMCTQQKKSVLYPGAFFVKVVPHPNNHLRAFQNIWNV